MAGSSFVSSGIDAFRQAVERFPDEVTRRLKEGATAIGHRQQARARDLLLQKTAADKTPATQATATAAAIEVFVEPENKRVLVVSRGVASDPANNPIWLEYGTVHQSPKPYMRPAADETRDEYRMICEKAAREAAEATFR
jgi:HK97 gp10 family phage protein